MRGSLLSPQGHCEWLHIAPGRPARKMYGQSSRDEMHSNVTGVTGGESGSSTDEVALCNIKIKIPSCCNQCITDEGAVSSCSMSVLLGRFLDALNKGACPEANPA